MLLSTRNGFPGIFGRLKDPQQLRISIMPSPLTLASFSGAITYTICFILELEAGSDLL